MIKNYVSPTIEITVFTAISNVLKASNPSPFTDIYKSDFLASDIFDG